MIGRTWLVLLGALLAAGSVPAYAAEYPLAPGQAAIGAAAERVTQAQDTLLDIAREYDLGYVQLVAANPGIDPWLPGAGKHVVIPSFYLLPDTPRTGIVINLAERRVFYFPAGGGQVVTYPAGVGTGEGMTPRGATRVVAKEAAPIWVPPPSIRAENPALPQSVGPGPDNPLGAFALRLGWPRYLIHGTNKPDSVGRNVSHGCLHLYPEDIAALFARVPVGTPVRVIDQPVEAAWIGDRLLVEVHASKSQADDIDNGRPMKPAMPTDLLLLVARLAAERDAAVDWTAVRRAGLARNGLPTAVARAAPPDRVASGEN